MKKRLAVIILACVLAFALPCLAFAVSSPTAGPVGDTDTYGNKATLTVKAQVNGDYGIKIVKSDTDAKNYVKPANEVAKQSFTISVDPETDANWEDAKTAKVTMVYTTDASFSGLTCTVYIEHHDGTTEVKTATVAADGTVTVEMTGLSTVTFSIDKPAAAAATTDSTTTTKAKAAASDSKSESPKTGVVA